MKAKANQKVGNKIFYKGEPVVYFDTLKTSTLEGAATTVYATGGRGNARLMAWDGERTTTFTMEDALISPEGLTILTGAGLISAEADKPITVHVMETTDETYVEDSRRYVITETPVSADPNATIYGMIMEGDELVTEPIIFIKATYEGSTDALTAASTAGKLIEVKTAGSYALGTETSEKFVAGATIKLDYYTDKASGAMQIDITPDKFGGNYYLEASTLFRNSAGVDMPAEFIIPNCKVQSNFTFTMASSGDPSELMRLAA